MSRYEVFARSCCVLLSPEASSSSMTTHSEFPVSGSTLSWNIRDAELMLRTVNALERGDFGMLLKERKKNLWFRVLGNRHCIGVWSIMKKYLV